MQELARYNTMSESQVVEECARDLAQNYVRSGLEGGEGGMDFLFGNLLRNAGHGGYPELAFVLELHRGTILDKAAETVTLYDHSN